MKRITGLVLLLPVSADTRQCFLVAWDRPASVLETAAWCAGPAATMGVPPHRETHP